VIPAVLAMLGDNPMQSELACHIGLTARLFCRICWVSAGDEVEGEEDEATLDSGGSDVSTRSEVRASTKGRSRIKASEKWEDKIARALRFMDVGLYCSPGLRRANHTTLLESKAQE
jgi:hypothetical protein